jgi:hypothetical protein
MPTNLPPEYFEVEKRYRAATAPAEKAALLEELLGTIPKHKGTDKLRADLRRRLSKLKDAAQTKKSAGKRDSAFRIDKEGAGQAMVVGPPNVGKSALVRALTNAAPEVADYPYTTWDPTPGMVSFEGVQIQLVDTPPLNPEYVEPELMDMIRRADLVLLVVDLQADPIQQLDESVALLGEYRVAPRRFKERYADPRRMAFIPFLVLANKSDDAASNETFEIFRALLEDDWRLLPVSATTGRNLDRMKQMVFDLLDIIRVHTKAPGRDPDLTTPFVLKKGSTVEDLAAKVHKDFAENLKLARVWGEGVFDGQPVGRDHVLHDRDVVELHL